MQKHILSKSTFVRGVQCEKSLWLNKYRRELRDELSAAQEAIFVRGHVVGEYAQQLFPNGVCIVPPGAFPSAEYIDATKQAIERGEEVLYEACFLYNDVLCAMDIMVKRNGRWYAYEVKSSTSVSDTYILDASLQSYIIIHSGIDLADLSIVHLDNSYVRNGDLDICKLFAIESIFEQSKELRQCIPSQIERLKAVLQQNDEPQISIGEHCCNPYACDFYGYCWKHIPTPSVFDLYRMNITKKCELYSNGIISLADVPDSMQLTEAQHIQVQAYKTGKVYIDSYNVQQFIQSIHYPVLHLDFETMMPAIPLFDKSRPYQQICFQYSLHIQQTPHSEVTHLEFLAEAQGDPRLLFIQQLITDCGTTGDILVYNQNFERTRLHELAEDFPQYRISIEKIINRIVDLMIPFQKKWVYHPDMNGSFSIKYVLPVLIPNVTYKGMKIADGGTAMNAFESLYYSKDDTYIHETREALLKYCEMDTWAMVKLLEYLKGI